MILPDGGLFWWSVASEEVCLLFCQPSEQVTGSYPPAVTGLPIDSGCKDLQPPVERPLTTGRFTATSPHFYRIQHVLLSPGLVLRGSKATIMQASKPATVDEYIAAFSADVQERLTQLRTLVKKVAPKAEEGIGYGMPAYKFNGPLVYFAGYKKHIGFYPTPSGIQPFEDELSVYKNSKGAVQFPLTGPLPLKLIERMVKFRVKENEAKALVKKKGRTV